MSAVDCVVLVDQDGDEIPPRHVIRLHGHPGCEATPRPGLSIEFCAADETNVAVEHTLLASFYLDAEDLYAALDLVLPDGLAVFKVAP